MNARPTITPFALSTDEDKKHTFTTEFASNYNDADGDVIANVQIKQLPTKGRLFLGDNPVLLNAEIPAIEINKLNYRPLTDSNGTDIIKWNASDGVYYSILGRKYCCVDYSVERPSGNYSLGGAGERHIKI